MKAKSKSSKKSVPSGKGSTVPDLPVVAVESGASTLRELSHRERMFEFEYAGRRFKFLHRPIGPEGREDMRLLQLEAPIPPVIEKSGQAEVGLDIRDAGYQREMDRHEHRVRAATIWLSLPQIQAEFPGLTKPDEMRAALEGAYKEPLLELLHAACSRLEEEDAVDWNRISFG